MLKHLCYYIGLKTIEDINNCVALLHPLLISHSSYVYIHSGYKSEDMIGSDFYNFFFISASKSL
jgi:hypothetical protein